MSTKKKLVISLTSLAIVLVVAVAAVGITLAALNGTVESGFKISYVAHNVSATVSAKYNVGESGPDQKFSGGTDGSLIFQPDTETATGSLNVTDPDKITLDWTTNKYVVVTYTFKNNWTSGDETKTKLVVTADKETITGADGIKITYDTDGTNDFNNDNLSDLAAVNPEDTLTVKIKFELTAEGSKSVDLSVSLKWTLTTQAIGD